MRHQPERVDEQRQLLVNGAVVLDVRLPRSGTDHELLAFARYRSSSTPAIATRCAGCASRKFIERDQALPARENPSVVAEIPQYRDRFGASSRTRWYSELTGFIVFASVNAMSDDVKHAAEQSQ